jgi:hypothetical protein
VGIRIYVKVVEEKEKGFDGIFSARKLRLGDKREKVGADQRQHHNMRKRAYN